MGAEVSSIGDQIGRFAQCLSTEKEIVDLAHENVIIFDVLACKRYDERKMRQRYVFLLPGLLAVSDELKNPRDAFWAAIRDLNLRGTGLDIRLNTNIDSVNSKTLRIWNTSLNDSEDDGDDEHSFDPDESGLNASTVTNTTEEQEPVNEKLFAGIPERDRKSCLLVRFRDESDARYWERLLNSEKDKVYFPPDTFYTDYSVSVHAIHAALMHRFEKLPKNAPLRAFYYSSQTKDGTGIILSYLYHFFFSNVFEDEMNIDLAEAFVTFLDIIVSSPAVAMVVIAFEYAPDFLDDFYSYRKSALSVFSAPDPAVTVALEAGDSINNVTLVQFANYIRRKVDAFNWTANREFLADVLDYPGDSPFYAKTAVSWFNTIKSGEGKFSVPFLMTWTELKLLLAPTPFCAFYFLRHYMLVGQIEYARKISTTLEYAPTTTFIGLKTGPDGISPIKKPSTSSASSGSTVEWKGSPMVTRSPIDPEQLKVTPKYEQSSPERKAGRRGSKTSTTHVNPAQGHTTPTKHDIRAKIKHLEQEEVVSAHFISYVEWDFIQRIYDAFRDENSENRNLDSLLRLSRKVFASPLVSSASLAGKTINRKQYVEYAIQQLSSSTEPAVTEDEKDLAVMKELCLKWMEFNLSKENIADGNTISSTQTITMLTLINWARSRGQLSQPDDRSRKVSIVQAGPEEDRPCLCALSAAFFVSRMKKKVHILYENESLMHKDFDRFAPFLTSLGVDPSCNDFETDDLIAFCTKQELCQFYRYNVFRGQSPFSEVILMSPDVDELHIERDLLTVFAKRDDQMSPPLRLYFDLFLQIGDAAQSPVESSGLYVYSSWARAKLAFSQYKEMIEDEPNGFTLCSETGRYELLDGGGEVVFNKNHLGLDMARYHLAGDAPVVQSTFFYQSVPFIIGTHNLFVGFCKAVNAKPCAEGPIVQNRPHLWSMFGAWSFTIPDCREAIVTNINPGTTLAELLEQHSSILKPKKPVEASEAILESSLLPWNWIDVPGVWSAQSTPAAAVTADGSNPQTPREVVVDMPVGWSAILDRGLMNGYLCESFYRKFPYEGGKWPDKPSHRKLIEYLDSDESRTLEGCSNFATSVRLARSTSEFVREFRTVADSFH